MKLIPQCRISLTDIIAIFIVALFLVKCLSVASNIKTGVLPDEHMHISVIKVFYDSDSWLVPSQEINPSQIASQDKFLYHLFMGKSARLLGLDSNAISYYRMWSILFSTLTVIIFYLITLEVFKEKSLRIIALILFTNILMFTATSVSISYDPMTNLIAIGIIWIIIKLSREWSTRKVLILNILLVIGTVTKTSLIPFLPLALFFVVYRAKSLNFKNIGIFTAWKNVFLAVILIFATAFAIKVHLSNYNNYGKFLNLSCTHVFGQEECLKKNALTEFYSNLRKSNVDKPREPFIRYYDNWVDLMISRTFGIAAHQVMDLSSLEYSLIKLLLWMAAMGIVLCFWRQDFIISFMIFIYYFIIIALYVNYKSYLSHGDLASGVHGRYLFPVLGPAIIVFTSSFYELSKKLKRPLFLPILACCTFFYLDYPSYINDSQYYLFQEKVNNETLKAPPIFIDKKGSKINIDFINDQLIENADTVRLNFIDSETISVKGWAFDDLQRRPAHSLVYKLNDGPYKEAVYGLSRQDVGLAFQNKHLNNTGFFFEILTSELDIGPSYLAISVLKNDGKAYGDSKHIILVR